MIDIIFHPQKSDKYNPFRRLAVHILKHKVNKILPLIEEEFQVAREWQCKVDLVYRPPRKSRLTLGAARKYGKTLYCWINAYSFPTSKDIAETLAHEFTHLQQYADGRLADFDGNPKLVYWAGILMGTYTNNADMNKYLNSPWEVEARDIAAKFVEKYYG